MDYEDWLYLYFIEVETVLDGRDTCDKKQFSIIGFRHIKEISGKKDRAIRLFIVSIFNFIKMIYF